jgi:hypothetical protein
MKPSRFPETEWSLVARAAVDADDVRTVAVAELLKNYSPALRAFLVETRRIPPDTAEDILQGFIADRIVASRILARAEKRRGKLRSFLVKSLSNFANTWMSRERTLDARTVDLDESILDVRSSAQGADRFDQEWIRSLVADALTLMEDDCRSRERADLWEIFRLRVALPILDGVEPVGYDRLIEQLHLDSPRQAINLLTTAKRAFLRHLRVAVGRYVSGEDSIDEEISDLRAIVGR